MAPTRSVCPLLNCLVGVSMLAGTSQGAQREVDFSAASLSSSVGSTSSLTPVESPSGRAARWTYDLRKDGYVNAALSLRTLRPTTPIAFLVHVDQPCQLEIKFVYADGSTFGCRAPLEPAASPWQRLVVYPRDAEHWWGGEGRRGQLKSFELAVTGSPGPGVVDIARVEIGGTPRPSSFGPPTSRLADAADSIPLLRVPYHGPLLDPDRELAGFGTRQRRSATMLPEDPLVLEWLKLVQDHGSPEKRLLPSTISSDECQTFNNALVAMAFIRHDERERAERILGYFADAARDRDNDDPTLQSFYLRGEARGFYQRVSMRGENGVRPYHALNSPDRWMGDMVWLALALRDYQQTYRDDRYEPLLKQIVDLLKSWYIDNPKGPGGYVQHGWRKGDAYLHEDHGHHEGNIDCIALFTLLADRELARQIRIWLKQELGDRRGLPLDLYTWRVMAEGGRKPELLDVPDFDLRYRKTVTFRGREVVGPYHGPDSDAENIWFDGLGHLACAYNAAGNQPRANFYANQMDAAIIAETVAGRTAHSIPYTAKSVGDYGWVNVDEGFISVAAWYIFAKHRFNPLTLEQN